MPIPTRVSIVALGLAVFWRVTVGATSRPIWQDVDATALAASSIARDTLPVPFRLVALDRAALEDLLAQAPTEASAAAQTVTVELPLPMPDGTLAHFRIVEAPVMAPELARRFPQIRTYRGQGLDDPTATLRFDLTPGGFHAQILRAGDSVYIDPLHRGETVLHQSYLKRDLRRNPDEPPFVCHVQDPEGHARDDGSTLSRVDLPATPSGTTLRTYRLALAGTGEYTAAVCAPNPAAVACGLAAMVTSMNRVNGVYEREVAIRMVLVANNDQLVYTDGTSDPYTNNDGYTMLGENQANLDAVIGTASYDIGHVFSTGGGGIAQLKVPCQAGWKAQGVTGRSIPVGDPFDIDYVAHEMGHQWGALHTFNGTTGSCGGGNRSASAAYEPGSGSTIMAYAGICGAEDLQPNSDDIFHTKSFDEIVTYSTTGNGNTCAQKTPTGNTPPTVNPGASYTVPKQTPFTLTGSASDPNGDALTYLWEEYDLGASSPPQGDTTAARPIFRTFTAVTSPSRTFPRLADILANTQTFGEWMSNRTRTMTFRLTVRDNRAGGGGVDRASTTVNVSSTAGPFAVTQPTTGTTWSGDGTAAVSWNVASSNLSPVNCSAVDILLSTNGGASFPTVLAADTPNDGAETVAVPAITTSQARVKVLCRNNIFFDISNPDFAIACVAPGAFTLTAPADASTFSGNTMTLEWAAAPGARNYDVYLGTETDPPLVQTTTEPTLTVAVTPGQTYNWEVVARNGCGQTPVAGTWAFTVTAPLLEPVRPVEVDRVASGTTGDLNGVLEPGETVVVSPSWRNDGTGTTTFTGVLSDFSGPGDVTYSLVDSTGDYGSLPAGATGSSQSGPGNSYVLGVSSPATRPALHWDSTVVETLSTGSSHTWTLHIGRSFTDVPAGDPGSRFIETLLHNHITSGCDVGMYCPASSVTRWQMAVFIAQSLVGPEGVVPVSGTVGASSYDCVEGGTSLFGDVPAGDAGCKFIHFLYCRGITAGCGPGIYCPGDVVDRWQMAVFLAAGMVGPGGTIPVSGEIEGRAFDCSAGGASLFTDVQPTDGGCPAVHYIFGHRVTAGCDTGMYCPGHDTTRWQMAVFLTVAFGLELY